MVTQLKHRRFRPHPAATVVAVAFTLLFTGLGIWQLDRASQKESMASGFEAQRRLPAVDPAVEPVNIDEHRFRDASMRGEYLAGHQILVDNVVFEGRPGYEVFTPLRVSDSAGLVLVDRGWISQGPRRGDAPEVPVPQGTVTVSGWIDHPRSKPVIIAGEIEASRDVWPYLDTEALEQRLGASLPPYMVRATNEPQLLHKAPEFDAKTGMHIGYAIQWFAFAAAAAGTYVAVSLRKTA